MLPSTGYFKKIICPFYESGLCERPYCHFRHTKKEPQSGSSSDGVEKGDNVLQKLVSAAVHKVLTKPDSSPSPDNQDDNDVKIDCRPEPVVNFQPVAKATYNPTPISKLTKITQMEAEEENDYEDDDGSDQQRKHIPVPYTPRKPIPIPVKRPPELNGSTKPFVYQPSARYTPGSSGTFQDPYMPQGTAELDEKYTPGSEIELQEYTPNENQPSSNRNYVPSSKSSSKKKVLEYRPLKISSANETCRVTYEPTLKSLAPCFSSDEEEPDTKKRKLSSDMNSLDDLGPEFDILDQILDEEKNKEEQHNKEINMPMKNNDTKVIVNQEKHKKLNAKKEDGYIKSEHVQEKDKNSVKENKHTKNDSNKERKSSKSETKEDRHSKEDKKQTKSSSDREHRHSKKDSDKDNSKSYDKHSKNSKSDKKDRSHAHKSEELCMKHKEKHRHKESTDKKEHHSTSETKSKSSETKSNKDKTHHKHSGSSKKHKDRNHKKSSKDSKGEKHKDKYSSNLFETDFIPDDTEQCNMEEELSDMSEPDEEKITLECKRIFEEYVPEEKKCSVEKTNSAIDEDRESEYIPAKKRISRTVGKDVKVVPKAPLKPNFKVSAAETMAKRLSQVRQFHEAKKTETEVVNAVTIPEPPKTSLSTPSYSKIRIAHVPYASTLLNAKKTLPPSVLKKKEQSVSSTTVQTIKKGSQRVAHIPNEKFIDRPGVLEPLASKIPANIRSTYLNMMIDVCLKIYLTATDAYARAQHEELTTSKKCTTIQIYKNSAVLTVSRLRKELQECNGVKKSGSECTSLQKIPNSVGDASSSGSWSIENKHRRVGDNSHEFKGARFYINIKKWILTEEQLQDNGFPRPHPSGEKGRAIIYGQNKQKPPKGFIRTCCRCKKDFTVDKKGFAAVKEECIYHPNNKYRIRGEVKYQCCSQDGSSDGCCVAPCHVYEYVDFDNLKGFVKTMPPEKDMDNYGVYSLDCEMCYTTHGLDLTRVTVINSECKVVYETLIKPLHPIVDYNTRYSGITEEQMEGVKTTLLEVQATLLSMFNSKTILLGHSLESDFKALKLIHDSVIDTSVLFPHKMGPPYKRALRNLSSEYLKKIIQNSVDGHDSAEDATVCMELVIYKLKEDLKTR